MAGKTIVLLKLLKKIIQLIARWLIVKPLAEVGSFLYKRVIVNLYRLYLFIKKQFQREKTSNLQQHKIFSFLNIPNLGYTVIILLTISVVINNFLTKNTYAEDYAKNSAVYKLIGADEFEALEEEVIFIEENYNVTEANINKASPLELAVKYLPALETTATTTENIVPNLGTLTQAGTAVIRSNITTTSPAGTPRAKIITYVVQPDDTVSSIAQYFGVSVNTILWENKLTLRSLIKPGDNLKILPVSGVNHTVKKGETIDAIAKKYQTDVETIYKFNNLPDASFINVGQNLIIPGGKIIYIPVTPRSNVASLNLRPSEEKISSGGLVWPTVSKRITQYFSWRHRAIDIGGTLGSPIYSVLGGTVERAGWTTGYGNNIIISHGNGKKTLYGHMTKLLVKRGDEVSQGQVIGLLGSTGWSTGPHLHLEILINGAKVNPLNQL